jgi:hypothetical protein
MVSCKFNGRLKPCPYQPTTVEQDCGRKKKRQKGETRLLFNWKQSSIEINGFM